MRLNRFSALLVVLSLCTGLLSSAVLAVPYAANVRNTGGTNWEFVLNEAADAVTILRDGGNALNLGALGAGRHSFSMSGFSNFDIQVSKSAPVGWATIGDTNNPFSHFTIPSGVIINNDPSDLSYFGTVYVSSASTGATKSGRAMGSGIYALTADMIGVDAATFAAVADPNDTSQAKAPGFNVTGSQTASPWRLNFDASGNLLISDWSDAAGGVKYANRSLTAGGLVLGGVEFDGSPVPDGNNNGRSGGIFSQEEDQDGRIPLHGSIAGRTYSTGTVGVDLTLWVMDEDLDVQLSAPNNDTNSIWRHNVGSATNFDALAPTMVVQSTAIPNTSDNRANFIGAFGSGVAAGMFYSEQYGKWYLNQPRTDGNQSSITIISAALDGSEATAPTVEWSSLQFSIDNGLDAASTIAGIQDVFRRTREVTITADGKYLVAHRNGAAPTEGILGPGAVLFIPLDENGIPDIQISGGVITNVFDLTTLGNNGAHNSGAQVEFDAAGNMYVANSAISTTSTDPLLTGQLIQVFSPGGNWTAITKSDGTFELVPLSVGLTGDYNGDGTVDAADYVLWRSNPGAYGGDPDGYNAWRANFGMGSPGAGSGSAAVPEPAAFVLLGVGLLALLGARRREM